MAWTIIFDPRAQRQFERLDHATANRIRAFFDNRVAHLDNPRQQGKALQGSRLGSFWVYRVGDYRIICDIQDHHVVVLVVSIGNRRDVYR